MELGGKGVPPHRGHQHQGGEQRPGIEIAAGFLIKVQGPEPFVQIAQQRDDAAQRAAILKGVGRARVAILTALHNVGPAQKRRRQPREQNAAHQIATDDKNQFPDHTNLPVYALKWNPSATIIRAAPRNAIDNCGLFVQQFGVAPCYLWCLFVCGMSFFPRARCNSRSCLEGFHEIRYAGIF